LIQGTLDLLILKTIAAQRAKFYSLTQAGHTQLEKELANWDHLSSAINRVMRTAE
jgi:DNA-binding PadR family transcriptional regulator